jgi:glycosyltransferase involved in cell wall biosynthesis
LIRTIESVAAQRFRAFEFIVIDGASHDGSQEVIKDHAEIITSWISEKDKGIYDAMNKGIRMANGEYLLFLNSGDTLVAPDTLANVIPALGNEEIVYGNLKINDKGNISDGYMPDILTLEHMVKDTLWHPVSFIKKQLLPAGYSTAYKICGDYDFFFRSIIIDKVSYRHIPEFIAEFHIGGLSSSPDNIELIKKEKQKVQESYLSKEELSPFTEVPKKVGLLDRFRQWFQ